MKTKTLLIGFGIAIGAQAFAGPVPKHITARYKELEKVMIALDSKGFADFFAADFVNVDPKGNKSTKAELISQIKPMFDAAKKAHPSEKLMSATIKNGVIDVQFDFVLKLTGKDGGETTVHEVGTDSWKQVGGKWVFIKTVDKKFDVTTTKPKAGKAKKSG